MRVRVRVVRVRDPLATVKVRARMSDRVRGLRATGVRVRVSGLGLGLGLCMYVRV